MSNMNQADVERIATEYVKNIEIVPFIIDGSEFDDSVSPSIWRVYIGFREPFEEWIGLPHSLIVEVNDATGEASHIKSL